MKNLILPDLFLFSSAAAFAAPASEYTCVGNDAVSQTAVNFNVLFSDYGNGAGYTNQSISINAVGGVEVKNGTFQMYDATEKNTCKVNSEGETFLSGKALDMQPSREGDLAPYIMTVKVNCGKDKAYDIKGYCFSAY